MPGTFDDVAGGSSSSTGGDQLVDFKDYNGRMSSWTRSNSSSQMHHNHSRSGSALDRHSESSESLDNQSTTSSGTCSKMMTDFGGSTEYIPTRSTKTAPKVAYNPMQFVKTGPTKLALTAQEQLKKAEEVKKVREKKRDDAEDWQSNLEGWKSSRRKRQEHVIERVTEVKRMEQEEALKASEAAAKRLIGIREKRGKLSALYSVEDNDEIEFDSVPSAPQSDSRTTDHEDPQSPSEDVFHSNTEEKPQRRPSPEFTYDKAIEDYVKYSTTALSSAGAGGNSNKSSSSPQPTAEIVTTTHQTVIQRKEEAAGQESAQLKTKAPERKPTALDNSAELVTKRRNAFEQNQLTAAAERGAASEASERESREREAVSRRSGEFSSTFKNRLSTFEVEDKTPEPTPVAKVTPDRDPQFKNKLANFKVADPAPVTAPPPPVNVVAEEDAKPDFKAKLAAFRQVEASAVATATPVVKPVIVPATLKAPSQPVTKAPHTTARAEAPINTTKEDQPGKVKPAQAVCTVPPPCEPPPAPPVAPPLEEAEAAIRPVEEPIYANTASSSYAGGFNPASSTSTAPLTIRPEPSESSDCTEDEGIRSLSPHGTPSPTSPTQERRPTADDFEDASDKMADQQQSAGAAGAYRYQLNAKSDLPAANKGDIGDPAPAQWPPSEVVWDSDWVSEYPSLLDCPAPAPPSEKPPPPPPPEDDPSDHLNQQMVARRADSGSSDGNYRQELRKRRSDFLGFDVKAVEDDARELAEAIPPPPDLKSVLRSTSTSYKTSEQLGISSSEQEERLAAQERAIIETLEKEEQERLSSSGAGSSELHNRSNDGTDCDGLTAEIDQLALEWAADAMGHSAVSAGWKPPAGKLQHSFPPPPPPPIVMDEPAAVVQQRASVNRVPLQVAVTTPPPPPLDTANVKSVSPSRVARAAAPPASDAQLHSPPKPSRLSAAPKPRLHDGEAWMAKRKVASEGNSAQPGGRTKEPKDVSRHWLIQEAEQRRIDAMQERNYSPHSTHSSASGRSSLTGPAGSHLAFGPGSAASVNSNGPADQSSVNQWMSRSSSSTSMDKMMPELVRLQGVASGSSNHGMHVAGGLNPSLSSRSASSLGSSPTPRPLYANQEEILEFADFTGAPHTAPPVWQVRSLVNSGSMDQLSTISPPSRPMKTVNQQHSRSQTLLPVASTASASGGTMGMTHQQASHAPSWRSNGHPPAEVSTKESIAPLPHSVIHTLTQRMSQRNSGSNINNNPNNYGDYMNIQEAVQAAAAASSNRAAPQVPAQRPTNYRHPTLGPAPSNQSTGSSSNGSIVGAGPQPGANNNNNNNNDRMLSVSGKKKCSFCQEELGRGAAMIIESLRLFYHINCFRCCVCGIALGNGTAGTDVRVRNNNLHCHDCYSNDDGLKFSKV